MKSAMQSLERIQYIGRAVDAVHEMCLQMTLTYWALCINQWDRPLICFKGDKVQVLNMQEWFNDYEIIFNDDEKGVVEVCGFSKKKLLALLACWLHGLH